MPGWVAAALAKCAADSKSATGASHRITPPEDSKANLLYNFSPLTQRDQQVSNQSDSVCLAERKKQEIE